MNEARATRKVVVTHFINPHLFWYHEANEFKEEFQTLNKLEYELQFIGKQESSELVSSFSVEIGDVVAVLYLKWNKFIRAEILRQPQSDTENFIVWAIDYGFPFLTKKTTMILIPATMTKRIDYIKRGGIFGIIPKTVQEYSEDTFRVQEQGTWWQGACGILHEKLLNASSITFNVSYRTLGKHHWGNLIIEDAKGESLNVRDYLVKKCYALEKYAHFESLVLKLQTLNFPRWMTNDRQAKLRSNSEILNGSPVNQVSRRKVEEWCARVTRQAHLPDVTSNTECVDNSFLNNSTDNIDSISVVLQQQQHQQQLPRNKNNQSHCAEYYHDYIQKGDDDERHFRGAPDTQDIDNDCNGLNHKFGKIHQMKMPTKEAKGGQFPQYFVAEHSGSSTLPSLKNKSDRMKHQNQSRQKIYPNEGQNQRDNAAIDSLEFQICQINFKKSNRDLDCESLESKTSCLVDLCVNSDKNKSSRSQQLSTIKSACLSANSTKSGMQHRSFMESHQKKVGNNYGCVNEAELGKSEQVNPKTSNGSNQYELLKGPEEFFKSKDRSTQGMSSPLLASSTGELPSRIQILNATPDIMLSTITNSCTNFEKSSEQQLEETVASATTFSKRFKGLADTEEEERSSSEFKNNNNDNFQMECNNFRVIRPSYSKSPEKISKQIETSLKASHIPNSYENCKLIPAGFDITRLRKYCDEENHWHRKASTRYDNIPHDNVIISELTTTFNGTTNKMSRVEELLMQKPRDAITASLSSTSGIIDETFNGTTNKMSRVEELLMQKPGDVTTVSLSSTSGIIDETFNETTNKMSRVEELLMQKPRDATTASLSSTSGIIDETENISRYGQPSLDEQPQRRNAILNRIESKKKISMPLEEIPKELDDYIANSRHHNFKSPTEKMKKADSILMQAVEEKENYNNQILDLKALLDNKIVITTTATSITNSIASSVVSSANITSRKFENSPTLEILPATMTTSSNNNEKFKNKSRELIIKVSECLPIVKGEGELKLNFVKDLLLAHSSVPLHSIDNIVHAGFLPEIYNAMLNMRITNIFRVQVYSWSHISRGNSCFVVNSRKSGKTWSYLPAICSSVSFRAIKEIATYGPIAIILVASAKHVEHVTELSRHLLSDFNNEAQTVVPSFGIRNFIETKCYLLDSCGLLIATPSSFLRLIKDSKTEPLFDTKRIQHIVIDDLDYMQNRALDDLHASLKVILKMCKRPLSTAQDPGGMLAPQLIVTSKSWDGLMGKLIRISNQPLLVMGDFLEAAIYGRAVISIKLCSRPNKAQTIMKFIKKQQRQQMTRGQCRTIIICKNDSDVQLIVEHFTAYDYSTIAFYTNCPDRDSDLYLMDEWKSEISDQILVCTDDRLKELGIQNALNLIHYSMPTSWTKFTQRFSVLADSYENFVFNKFKSINNKNNNANVSTKIQNAGLQSLILLDEENNIHLPRLVDFMVSHNQVVHPDVLAVAKRERRAIEMARIKEGVLLCPELLEFGDCTEPMCTNRHELMHSDVVTPIDDIPSNGDMRVHILKVFSPTHYAARLIEHKPINSPKWQEVKRSSEAAKFLLNLKKHYDNPKSLIIHWPAKLNDICVYMYSDTYRRACIINVPPLSESMNVTVNDRKVTIKLIDDGVNIMGVKCGDLFQCDEKFKDFPALAVDLRLCNVVPHDNERLWDRKATKQVEKWIIKDIAEDHIVQVNINFALIGTIWINNLMVLEKLHTVGTYVQVTNIKKSLIDKEFCVSSSNGKNGKTVREVLEEHISLLKVNDSSNNSNNSLNNDSQICLDLFDESSQSYNLSNGNGNGNDIEINKSNDESVVTQISQNEIHECSTKVDKISNEQNKASDNVDDGDVKMKSNERWCELTLNEMISVEIGDESENGNWEDIFLQLCDYEHTNKFQQLNDFIKLYIEEQQTQQKDGGERSLELWKSLNTQLHNCIIKYDNSYLRARLCGIFGTEPSKCLYRFFLCDYAYFINVKATEIQKDDFYYETTDEIINFTPYQAIHCTLAGIQWNRFCKRYQVTKDYLYACGVEKNNIENRPIALGDLSINSYKILLYECENAGDFKNAQMFNLLLIDKGVTITDPKTMHFLEYTIQMESDKSNNVENEEKICNYDNNDSDNKVVSVNELLQCFERALNEDLPGLLNFFCGPAPEEEQQDKQQFLEKTEIQKKKEDGDVALKETEIVKNTIINNVKEEENKEECSALPSLKVLNKCPETTEHINNVKEEKNKEDCSALPSLKVLNKRPETTWYQTDYIIYLSIYVPDVSKYYLKVTESSMQFASTIQNVNYVLFLNFLGCIVPALVSHEIRGLNVIVRLVKGAYMKWPRLLHEETKYSWLKYNYDVNVDAAGIIHDDFNNSQKMFSKSSNIESTLEETDDSDCDSEEGFYHTYNEICNYEDIVDPLF